MMLPTVGCLPSGSSKMCRSAPLREVLGILWSPACVTREHQHTSPVFPVISATDLRIFHPLNERARHVLHPAKGRSDAGQILMRSTGCIRTSCRVPRSSRLVEPTSSARPGAS
jgi:hypothetical protein